MAYIMGCCKKALASVLDRGRKQCDRYAVGRAGHVVALDRLAEMDRRRIATVLAADSELDALVRCLAAIGLALHQLAHPS